MKFRSLLYTPALRVDRAEKALAGNAADIVCLDLEDATPFTQKSEARAAVAKFVMGPGRKFSNLAIRIQAVDAPGHDEDMDLVRNISPKMVVLPKAEDAHQIRSVLQELSDADVPVIVIIETARGVLNAREIIALPGIMAVCFGAEDLAATAGLVRTHSNHEVAYARSFVALACSAYEIPALDMVTADFGDDARFSREAREARELGYSGKMCIHPKQSELALAAFAPTANEIEKAKKILAAVKAGGAADGGVVVVDGQMIDAPLITQARRVLDSI